MEDGLYEELSYKVIGAAMEVHSVLGPGLLESAYEICLCDELTRQHIQFQRQIDLPIIYKGRKLNANYRIDLIVENKIVLELKAVTVIPPIAKQQLLTYLKLSGHRLGLLINFNTDHLKDGIERIIN